MAGDKLEAKVDRSALIIEMSAKLKTASDRWEEVCRLYDTSWKKAFETHLAILTKIDAMKKAREQAALDKLKMCLELACVFLPMVAGPAAIALAPILTARGKLLVNTIEKKAQDAWSAYAASAPVVSNVVKEIGKRSTKAAGDAATKIKDEIIGKLSPKYTKEKALAPNSDPLTAFIDNNRLTLDAMNKWVETCASWNVKGGWESELITVAHELFVNHPWIKSAPPIEKTQEQRTRFTSFLEMALWLRWARTLDEPYWQKIHDWYTNEYLATRTRDGKNAQTTSHRRWIIDALDFKSIYQHFRANFRKTWYYFGSMTLLDPESGLIFAEDTTIDLYVMIKKAKHSSAGSLLSDLMPEAGVADYQLLRELKKL